MIRFPLIILFYLFLWGINLWILDRNHLQYCGVIGIKSGFFHFICLFIYLFHMFILFVCFIYLLFG